MEIIIHIVRWSQLIDDGPLITGIKSFRSEKAAIKFTHLKAKELMNCKCININHYQVAHSSIIINSEEEC